MGLSDYAADKALDTSLWAAKKSANVALKTGTYAANKLGEAAIKKGKEVLEKNGISPTSVDSMTTSATNMATSAANMANKVANTSLNDNIANIKSTAINAHNSATNFVNENAEIGHASTSIFESAISLYFEILTIMAKYGIHKTAEIMGLDPSSLNYNYAINNFMSDVSQYKKTLTSEEGKKLMSELSDILIISINELEPVIQELIDATNRLIDKQVAVSQKFVLNELKIATGPIGSMFEIISDLLSAAVNMAESVETATGVVSDEMSTFQKINGKLTGWFDKLKTSAKKLNDYQEQQYAPATQKDNVSVDPLQPVNQPVNQQGGTRKNILAGGARTLMRTKKSIYHFLNSGIKSSQINKNINKRLTRKRLTRKG